MKNTFLLAIILIGCSQAGAEVMTSIGENNVFEREAYATQYSSRTPFALRVGYQEFSNAVFAEYNQFSTSDSFSGMEISRTQHEFLVWGRHSFWSDSPFQLYLQFAPGVQLQHVQTNFMSTSQQDTSRPSFALAGAVGGAAQVNRFRFEVELRAIASQIAAPNPTLSVGFYGGYLF